jgi:hypothetical protein
VSSSRPRCFKIFDERGGAAGHAEGERAVVAVDVFVRIPVAARKAVVVAAPDLDEAHATFEEAAGGEALLGKMKRLFVGADFFGPRLRAAVEAVEFLHVRGLGLEVERLGSGELHAGGEFVAADAGVEPLVALARGGVLAVEIGEETVGGGLAARGDKIAGGVGEEIGDGGVGAGQDDCAAVLRREEGRVPVFHAVGREAAVVGEHDEGGQVFVERAESVADPAAGAGETGQLKTGGLQERGGAVHAGLADHVVDEGEVIDDVAERGDDLAEHFAGLAVGAKIPERAEPRAETVLEDLDGLAEIAGLAVAFDQLGFVVEEIEVAGGAGHKKLHDAFRFGGVVQRARGRGRRIRGEGTVVAEHRGEGETAEAAAGLPEEIAAGKRAGGGGPMEGRVVGHRQSTKVNSFRLKSSRQRAGRPSASANATSGASAAGAGE